MARAWAGLVPAVRSLARGFQGENLLLRAAALTYLTFFSLVPLLTVCLALVGLFRQSELQRGLRQLVFTLLAPGVREESAAFITRLLESENYGALGSVGFLGLMVSAGSLLRNVDGSLNDIWGVRRKRPLWVSLLVYAGLLLVGPLLVALSVAGTGWVRNLLVEAELPLVSRLTVLLPPLVVVAGLTVLYYMAPHARVRLRAALAGAAVAGLGWELARHLYGEFAAYSFRSNPLYGSLSALPLFLAWLYVGWVIVLFGARLSYAVEHASFRDSLWAFGSHPRARELVGARVAQEASVAWALEAELPAARELAQRMRAPEPLVLEVVEALEQAGLLEHSPRLGLRPARHPAELTLAELTLAVHGVYSPGQPDAWSTPAAPGFEQLAALFRESDTTGLEVLRRTSWWALALLQRPELATAPPPAPTPGPALAAGNENP